MGELRVVGYRYRGTGGVEGGFEVEKVARGYASGVEEREGEDAHAGCEGVEGGEGGYAMVAGREEERFGAEEVEGCVEGSLAGGVGERGVEAWGGIWGRGGGGWVRGEEDGERVFEPGRRGGGEPGVDVVIGLDVSNHTLECGPYQLSPIGHGLGREPRTYRRVSTCGNDSGGKKGIIK